MQDKVAIYIRVSTHWQVDRDSLSVQRRELIGYSEFVLGINSYEVFEDPGYSAKNTERPAYQEMINRLRSGEFSHLLVWKIDRISRNLLDFSNLYAELKHIGVIFVSKNEQFDTSTAIGEAMLKIILVFAELERKMTAERVTAVMLSRANNGQWNGGRVPYGYGYNRDANEFFIDEDEAKVYYRIVSEYEELQSTLAVSDSLNKSGIRTRSGKEWSTTGLHKILTNIFYTGKYEYNKRDEQNGKLKAKSERIVIQDHHIAMISDERFNRVQMLLSRHHRNGASQNEYYVKRHVHIFSGLIKCGYCGARMNAGLARIQEDGYRPSVYNCATRRNNKSECSNKYITDDSVADIVFKLIHNVISAQKRIKQNTPFELFKKWIEKDMNLEFEDDGLQELYHHLKGKSESAYKPSVVTKVSSSKALKDQIRKSDIALTRLQNLYLYGDGMVEKDYIIEKERITQEKQRAEEALSKITEPDEQERAAEFAVLQKMVNDGEITFDQIVRAIDKYTIRRFVHEVIDHIDAKDGCVCSVTFQNGIQLTKK